MIVNRYIRVGYNLDIMRQSACLVLNPITVYRYIDSVWLGINMQAPEPQVHGFPKQDPSVKTTMAFAHMFLPSFEQLPLLLPVEQLTLILKNLICSNTPALICLDIDPPRK